MYSFVTASTSAILEDSSLCLDPSSEEDEVRAFCPRLAPLFLYNFCVLALPQNAIASVTSAFASNKDGVLTSISSG